MAAMAAYILALILLTISVYCLYCKKAIPGIVCSTAAAVFTYFCGYFWKELLKVSGKDTALLGFNRYPAAVILIAVLGAAAAIVFTAGVIMIIKKSKKKYQSAKGV